MTAQLDLKGMKVLIVEDEAMIALSIAWALEDVGAQIVGPVHDLPACMDMLETDAEIDVAILDVMLKDKEVFPAADILTSRGVPIVFHSGHALRQSLEVEYPDAQFFSKPCDPMVIASAICCDGQVTG